MMSTKIISYIVVILACIATYNKSSLAQTGDRPDFTCKIRVSPKTIVVYEPLRIDVKVNYQGTVPRKSLLPSGALSLVGLKIERETVPKETIQITTTQLVTDSFAHESPYPGITIPAHASSLFPLTVLYNWREKRFFFEKPGTYKLTILCDVPVEIEKGDIAIQTISDTSELIVRDYQGVDKAVWQKGALAFISGQITSTEMRESLDKLVENFPHSPYYPYAMAILEDVMKPLGVQATMQQVDSLENLIRKYPQFAWKDRVEAKLYQELMDDGQVLRAHQLFQEIGNNPWTSPVLKYQLKRYEPATLFPHDKRLDQKVTYEFADMTSLDKVLSYLSQQTGVPLSMDLSLKGSSRSSLRLTKPLRDIIKGMGGPDYEWIPDGEGYKLTQKEKIE